MAAYKHSNFLVKWYFDTINRSRFQIHRWDTKSFLQKLVTSQTCFTMASLIPWFLNALSRLLMSQQRRPWVCFRKITIIAIYVRFSTVMSHLDLLISSDPLVFLLLYISSLDNVFGCKQLKWTWHFKQCSVAPEFFQIPFNLLCWSSVALVITFSLFHLYTLQYICSLMRKCLGKN